MISMWGKKKSEPVLPNIDELIRDVLISQNELNNVLVREVKTLTERVGRLEAITAGIVGGKNDNSKSN